jgi:hypothetical protein
MKESNGWSRKEREKNTHTLAARVESERERRGHTVEVRN